MAENTPPTCPYLPPELWGKILSFVPSNYHLWTSCRRVSQGFAREVDHLFLTQRRLEALEIHTDRFYSGRPLSFDPAFSVVFDRFSADGARVHCIYRNDQPADSHLEIFNSEPSWNDYWRIYLPKPGTYKPEPTYAIEDKSSPIPWNDTELSELQWDNTKLQISFNWRKTLDLFYREEAYVDRRKNQYQSTSVVPSAQAKYTVSWKKFSTRYDEEDDYYFRMRARETRIEDWYQQHHNYDFEYCTSAVIEMGCRVKTMIKDALFVNSREDGARRIR